MTVMPLKVGVVQFAPQIGEVQANIAKAHELCKGLTPRSVDLLCFPEMIFTGYNFTDSESIRPYLENPGTGPTSVFCSELAQRLKCYVTAGFPERLEHSDSTTNTPQHLANTHSSSPPVGANSAVLYGPTGKLVSLYRKTNLFETDRTWAIPGDGFTVIDLPPPLGKTTIAICNDLNPKSSGEVCGDGKNGPCELADYCIQEGTGLLVVLAAWDNKAIDIEDEEPDCLLLDWWSTRLKPSWDEETKVQQSGSHLTVVISNRIGYERGTTFDGSSAMFYMCRGSGKPQLIDHPMGKGEEGVRIWPTVAVE